MPMPSEEGAAAIVVDWKRESVETVNRGSLWPCFGRPHIVVPESESYDEQQ